MAFSNLYIKQFLTDKEYENLIKMVNLLRVSEIRYIINKFSIPFKGNKTKLLNFMITLFNSLRYDKILIDMYSEINNILSNKSTEIINQLEIVSQLDPIYKYPSNPIIDQLNKPFMLGPISVQPGKSVGKFGFMVPITDHLINICFLFQNGIPHQFELKGDINGFPFEVLIDDPSPQPIDVTDFLNPNSEKNILNINQIQTSAPMMICIREYEYLGIQSMIDKIVGKDNNKEKEDFRVFSTLCQHSNSFSLIDYLSKSLATDNWSCPICGQKIDPFCLTVCGSNCFSE